MNYHSPKEFPQFFHVLPYEHRHLADDVLMRVREKDCAYRAALTREVETLFPFMVRKRRSELTVNRKYGVFGISSYANAMREGRCLRNHGEVYLYVWTFCKDGTFCSASAWGEYAFDAYPRKNFGVLVEL